MIVPVLRKNKKYSLYNTYDDFKPEDREFDLINISKLSGKQFDFIGPFREGIAIAKNGNKSIYINSNGQELITKNQYNELRDFEFGIAAVCDGYNHLYDELWTFINKNGIEIINQSFTGYRNLNNGFVEIESYWGHYDKYLTGIMSISGSVLFELSESGSYYFNEKSIQAHGGFYNYDGTKIKNDKIKNYKYIGHIRENRGIAKLKETNEYVIIDNEFTIIKNLEITNGDHLGEMYTLIPNVYGCYFYGKVCPIKKDNKWGIIDYNGNFVLNPKYDFIGGFTDVKMWDSFGYGCAGVGKQVNSEMKYSAINYNFQEITDFLYDEISLFNEGIASVRIGEKWGAINSLGQIIVPIEFNKISYSQNNLIKVGLGDFENNYFIGKFGIFNSKGVKITKIIYDVLYILDNGFIKFRKSKKYGILNNEGKVVVSDIYNSIDYVNNELLLAERNDEKFYVDFSGREFRQKS